MARVKVSDLVDVKEWTVPLLKRTWGSDVVHISERYGYGTCNDKLDITNCNRALGHAWVHRVSLDDENYKLCPLCGGREQFEKVWLGYQEFEEEYARKRDEEINRQMQAHKAEMAAMSLRLNGLMDLLLSRLGSKAEAYYFDVGNLALVGNGDGYARAVRFEYGGRVYEIQEVEGE